MANYKYKDFIIEFNIYKKNKLDKLIKYLESNYSFFCSLLPHKISFIDNSRSNYTYIDNIDIYINNIIKDNMNNKDILELKNKDNILMYLYRDYLYYELDKDDRFNKFIDNKDSNFILSLIAYIKYDDFNKIKSIILNSKFAKDKLINEVKNEVRVDLFNSILNICNKTIDHRFNGFYDIFIPLIDTFDKNYNITNVNYNYHEDSYNFTKIDKDKLENTFKEFLKYIDPSLEWLNEYNRCVDNKLIKFKKNINNEDYNMSGIYGDKIMISLNGNCHDFGVLSHEFAHHIAESNCKEYENYQDNIIREFPSFYYEMIAADYLENIGISKDEINDIKGIRRKYLIFAYRKISDLIKFSYIYNNKGNINYEEITNTFKNSYKYDLDNNIIDTALDRIIESFIASGTDNLYMICYIMADYLTGLFNNNDLDIMKNITEYLISYKFNDIIDFASNKKLIKK